MTNLLNVDEEMLFFRYNNGIKLVNPDQCKQYNPYNIFNAMRIITIRDFYNLPFNTYFLDTESNFCGGNEPLIKTIGCGSAKEIIGKHSNEFLISKESKIRMTHHDTTILKEKKMQIFREPVDLHSNTLYDYISIKFPLYNHKNNVIGIVGCSWESSQSTSINGLSEIAQLGLFTSPQTASACWHELSLREQQILHHVIRGKSATQIGKALYISSRTVETHLTHIKTKLNVNSKSELINLVLDNMLNFKSV